jgi:hypothetical protein
MYCRTNQQGYDAHGGDMDEAQWANKMAAKVKEKRHQEALNKETRLRDDEERRAQAPKLWQEFVGQVENRVKAFNRAMDEDALGIKLNKPDEVVVGICQFLTTVKARLEGLSLKCSLVSTSAEYEIRLVNGQVVFTSGRSGEVNQIDGIAERFVDDIIKMLY